MLPGGGLNLMPTVVLALLLTGQVALPIGVALLCVAFGFFLIAWGYLFRVFVEGLNGTESFVLPDWQAWRTYGLAGFWLFLIAAGYFVIAAVGISALISMLGLIPTDTTSEAIGPLSFFMLLVLVFFYGFFPVVFTRFAAEGRVWSAFEPGPLWEDLRKIVKADYVQACLGLFGLSLLGNLLLGALPVIGVVLASFFWFTVMVVFARVFGQMIRFALSPKGPPPARSDM